jgi:hypothetical protein
MALSFKPRLTGELLKRKTSSPLRLAIFCVGGLALGWLVISHSLVAYLSTHSPPELTLSIRPDDSQALLLLAANELERRTPQQPQLSKTRITELKEKTERGLIADPLSARAYRLLGQIAELEGSVATAETFMQAAARRSLKESFAIDWMMRKSVERKNHESAAYYADILMRSNPGTIVFTTPFLARMAEDSDARPILAKLLATNPDWRRAFFSLLGLSVSDARTPYNLLTSLQETAAPPTKDELNAYEAFLFQHRFYDLAYYVWLQFLPPERLQSAGFLFNGDFAKKPIGSRFDWQAPPGANVIVDFASRHDSAANRALVIDFGPGRVEFRGVSQTTMLAAGAYTFKGSYMGGIRGPRGVQWTARCIGGAPLGQSQMILGSHQEWRTFEFPVVIPAKDCPAQMFELKLAARSSSEKLVFGVLWFDDVSITRTESASN